MVAIPTQPHNPTLSNISPAAPPSLYKPPKNMPVSDVQVIIGYTDANGVRTEVVHEIGPSERITSVVHSVDEKQQKTKDAEGNFIGFEPTGEYVLKLAVKYNKE